MSSRSLLLVGQDFILRAVSNRASTVVTETPEHHEAPEPTPSSESARAILAPVLADIKAGAEYVRVAKIEPEG